MVEKKVVIKNPSGLHMRPANVLAQLAGKCSSEITITSGEKTFNPKSLLLIMSASITCGSEIMITCEGPEEEHDLQILVEAIENGLGE